MPVRTRAEITRIMLYMKFFHANECHKQAFNTGANNSLTGFSKECFKQLDRVRVCQIQVSSFTLVFLLITENPTMLISIFWINVKALMPVFCTHHSTGFRCLSLFHNIFQILILLFNPAQKFERSVCVVLTGWAASQPYLSSVRFISRSKA